MSSKYFAGNRGHYIFCDICGQACYERDAVRLSAMTGRGGLIVCPKDADAIDFSLISYEVKAERNVPFIRINEPDVINGAEPLDLDNTTELGV